MKLSAVMGSSVEIAVAGQNQPVGCFSITARLHRAKHVQTGYGASGRNFEKAAASVMPAGYANPIEVSIGTLHETCGASAIRKDMVRLKRELSRTHQRNLQQKQKGGT
jgi:hypothetical protein